MRDRISGAAEPARADAAALRLALALEVAAIRGYLITQDKSMLVDYVNGRAQEHDAFERLFRVTKSLDREIHGATVNAHTASTSWNEANEALARGELSKAAFIARLTDQQARFRVALGATKRLDVAIATFEAHQRQAISRSEKVGIILLPLLTLLATACATLILRFSSNLRHQIVLANTDPLTGLLNRRAFTEETARELARAARHQYAVTVIYIDVDDFKAVNDKGGHAAGDTLLQDIASSIRQTIRGIDVAARLGGDEFAILLGEDRAIVRDESVVRVQRAIMAELQARNWSITLSIGAVSAAPDLADVAKLIRSADELMYAVKRGAKGSIRWTSLAAS